MAEVLFGKYRLLAALGQGGMADVFLAVIAGPAGSGFSKLTVVKRLRQNLAEEPEFVEMLVDEARIAARLNHPNVVQTNEVGSVDNQYFIEMEYLDGQPLHRIQHRAMLRGQTPSESFPRECHYLILVETLAGLHHAHSLADYDGTPLEIVHRDVTPHNVFVTYEGQTKVVDFGIAKAVGRASETRQGVVKGKVRYMAPEQAIGQQVDRRADVFSVGIMLWEAATGRRLWKDMDDLNIVQALVGGTMMSSPRDFDPTVPEEVDRICRKALAYNVDDRYASAEDFRVDLEQYLAESNQLVSARRRLGAAVNELFKDKRAELKAVIESQLAQIKRVLSDPPVKGPLDNGSMPSTPTSAGAVSLPLDTGRAGEGATSMTDAATELYVAGSAAKRGKLLAGARLPLLIAAGTLIIVTAALAGTRHRTNADPQQVMTAPAQTVSVDVSLKVSTTPAAAQVSIDGAPLATPADARVPRDGKDHVVRVESVGFEPHTETVRFENDVALTVVLTAPAVAPVVRPQPSPPLSPPPPTRRSPPPTAVATTPTAAPPVVANAPGFGGSASSGTKPAGKVTIDLKEDPWKH